MDSNEKKAEKLGMPFGTANNRLKKNLLWSLVQKLNLDTCFQCETKIKVSTELSIEHKESWLYSKDPVKLFFDLDNISFSHLSCNVGMFNRTKTKCKNGHPLSGLGANLGKNNRGVRRCLSCEGIWRRRKRSDKVAK